MNEEKSLSIGLQIRHAMLNLLSLREYSRKELLDKLISRFEDRDCIISQLDSIAELGLQSDERFAKSFTEMRIRQGKGELFIRQDLQQKGIGRDLISQTLDELGVDWYSLARDVRRKKFGDGRPASPKDQAKQLRFLAGRGFSSHQSYAALDDDGVLVD